MKLLLFLMLTTYAQAEWKTFEISFYCNEGPRGVGCAACNGRYAYRNRTASGTIPTRYRTAGSNRLDFGTRVLVPRYGWRTIEDRMSSAYGHRLDIFTDSHARAKKLGVQKMKVWIERKPK